MSEEIKNQEEKPFNFWGFMGLMFLGLLFLTSLVLGIPYVIESIRQG